jgi:hypothetical protein
LVNLKDQEIPLCYKAYLFSDWPLFLRGTVETSINYKWPYDNYLSRAKQCGIVRLFKVFKIIESRELYVHQKIVNGPFVL